MAFLGPQTPARGPVKGPMGTMKTKKAGTKKPITETQNVMRKPVKKPITQLGTAKKPAASGAVGARDSGATAGRSSTGPTNVLGNLLIPNMGPKGFTVSQQAQIHKRQIAKAMSK